MKPSVVLQRAKAKIADPKHWIQGAIAKKSRRSKMDLGICQEYAEATCFCAYGAIDYVCQDTNLTRRVSMYLQSVVGLFVATWNDMPSRTHKDVMKAFDQAIQLAKDAGQ